GCNKKCSQHKRKRWSKPHQVQEWSRAGLFMHVGYPHVWFSMGITAGPAAGRQAVACRSNPGRPATTTAPGFARWSVITRPWLLRWRRRAAFGARFELEIAVEIGTHVGT